MRPLVEVARHTRPEDDLGFAFLSDDRDACPFPDEDSGVSTGELLRLSSAPSSVAARLGSNAREGCCRLSRSKATRKMLVKDPGMWGGLQMMRQFDRINLRNKLATATSTKIDRLTSIVQGRLSPYPTLVCVEFLSCPEGQMLHRIWNIEAAVELL